VRGPLPWDERPNRPWTEFDDLAATEWLQSADVAIHVGSGVAREAVQRVAYEQRFHPVLEWLEGLEWDGEKRLSGWLTTYLGVPKSPLADAIGRKFLISAVARVMRPGCKVDHVLILEGLQGTMKSKSLRALVSDGWFTDQIADLGTKDSCQDLRGVWVIELSEFSAIRPGEVEKVKAYVSRRVDHYRPSYGRRSIDVPRQCVFIGTTNDIEYLSDPTGGRRYWPVTCSQLDPEALARDRDQIWAEAVAAFHAGETWWLDDDELCRAAQVEQELRRIEDPWEETIAAWLNNPTKRHPDGTRMPFELDDGRVTVGQILEHAISKPEERQSKSDQMRVGKILRLLGWEKLKSHGNAVWQPKGTKGDTSSGGADPVRGSTDTKGVPPRDEVSPQGVPRENRAQSASQGTGDTGDTFSRAYTRDPCGSGPRDKVSKVSPVSPAQNGGADREPFGTCPLPGDRIPRPRRADRRGRLAPSGMCPVKSAPAARSLRGTDHQSVSAMPKTATLLRLMAMLITCVRPVSAFGRCELPTDSRWTALRQPPLR